MPVGGGIPNRGGARRAFGPPPGQFCWCRSPNEKANRRGNTPTRTEGWVRRGDWRSGTGGQAFQWGRPAMTPAMCNNRARPIREWGTPPATRPGKTIRTGGGKKGGEMVINRKKKGGAKKGGPPGPPLKAWGVVLLKRGGGDVFGKPAEGVGRTGTRRGPVKKLGGGGGPKKHNGPVLTVWVKRTMANYVNGGTQGRKEQYKAEGRRAGISLPNRIIPGMDLTRGFSASVPQFWSRLTGEPQLYGQLLARGTRGTYRGGDSGDHRKTIPH